MAVIVLAPHQDDETIRLAALVTKLADEGQEMTLLLATNGNATSVGPRLGLDRAEVERWRDRELWSAWAWLTDDDGCVENLRLQDGAATKDDVYRGLSDLFLAHKEPPLVLVATWHHDRPDSYVQDKHPDHVACVEAARKLAQVEGAVVRYARHPLSPSSVGEQTHPTTRQLLRIEGAVDSYSVIGHRSVRTSIMAALSHPTTVTR